MATTTIATITSRPEPDHVEPPRVTSPSSPRPLRPARPVRRTTRQSPRSGNRAPIRSCSRRAVVEHRLRLEPFQSDCHGRSLGRGPGECRSFARVPDAYDGAMTGVLLQCGHYDRFECRSCTWLERPYDAQLAAKQAATQELVRAALGGRPEPEWLPPVASAPEGFRTKAKMVVGGTVDRADARAVGSPARARSTCATARSTRPGSWPRCPSSPAFVTRAALAPYDVPTRSGELKHVLVTESPAGELMVRWVLRSTEAETRIRKHLPWLLTVLPTLRVVTLNIQPAHAALLEGERELVLTEQASLPMRVNGLTLHLGPAQLLPDQHRRGGGALPHRSGLGRRAGADDRARPLLRGRRLRAAPRRPGPERDRHRDQRRRRGRRRARSRRRGTGAGPGAVRCGGRDVVPPRGARRPRRRQPAAARPRRRAGDPAGGDRVRRRSSTPAATRRRLRATWPCCRRTGRCARRCSTCSRRPRTSRCWCCSPRLAQRVRRQRDADVVRHEREDRERVEDLVEAEYRAATGWATGSRRRGRRPCRGRRRPRSARRSRCRCRARARPRRRRTRG